MAIPTRQMEVERVMNLIRAFGWELVQQTMGEAKITLVVEKKLSPEVVAAGPGPGAGPAPS